jgi:arginine decarboxylase
MEMHLAILDGVGERYETPYFDNLKRYAARPIGTFHALPVARGKSIFKSNWIRDMGEFYGANLFLAESVPPPAGSTACWSPPATSSARRTWRRAPSAPTARSSSPTAPRPRTRSSTRRCCAPGDIVLIDRDCHKSHHYGIVLAGAQPLLHRRLPDDGSTRCTAAVPIRRSRRRCSRSRPRASSTARAAGAHQLHLRRPHVQRRATMEECLAIKPDLVFLWDEAWFGFARFSPFLRRRTAMGARPSLARDAARRRLPQALRGVPGSGSARSTRTRSCWTRGCCPTPTKVRIRVYEHALHAQVDVGAAPGFDDPGRDQDFRGARRRSRRRTSPTPRPRPTCRSSPRWTSRAGRWSWKATNW